MKYTLLLFMLLFSSASFSQVEDIDSIVLNLIENRAPWAGKIVNKKYYRLPELKKRKLYLHKQLFLDLSNYNRWRIHIIPTFVSRKKL